MSTLFDITRTGVVRNYTAGSQAFIDDADQLVRNSTEWNRSRNQQRNWETLLQLVGLRAQAVMLEEPKKFSVVDVQALGMGANYSSEQTVWAVSFATEHAAVYAVADNPVARLVQECDKIPMITGLLETAQLTSATLITTGADTNVVFAISDQISANYVESLVNGGH